jgi:hypothetical protein
MRSGNDVRQKPAFDQGDLIFQRQLALLQALKLKLVERSLFGNAHDHIVEIAMLELERRQFLLQHFLFVHGMGRTIGRLGNTRTPYSRIYRRP